MFLPTKKKTEFLRQSEIAHDNQANGIAIGPGGSVVLAGYFGSYDGQEFFLVTKLDSNGDQVWTFQVRTRCVIADLQDIIYW